MVEPITREQMARWLDERTQLISIHGNSAHERRIIKAFRSLLTDRLSEKATGEEEVDFMVYLKWCRHSHKMLDKSELLTCPNCLLEIVKSLQKPTPAPQGEPDAPDKCTECGRPMKRINGVVICKDCLLAYEKPQDAPGEGPPYKCPYSGSAYACPMINEFELVDPKDVKPIPAPQGKPDRQDEIEWPLSPHICDACGKEIPYGEASQFLVRTYHLTCKPDRRDKAHLDNAAVGPDALPQNTSGSKNVTTGKQDAPGEGEAYEKVIAALQKDLAMMKGFLAEAKNRLQKQRGAETARPSVTREDIHWLATTINFVPTSASDLKEHKEIITRWLTKAGVEVKG